MELLSRDKHVMPWRIEDEMKAIGANYVQAGLWRPFAIRDGNLITGQQNFSGTATPRSSSRRLDDKGTLSAETRFRPKPKPDSNKGSSVNLDQRHGFYSLLEVNDALARDS